MNLVGVAENDSNTVGETTPTLQQTEERPKMLLQHTPTKTNTLQQNYRMQIITSFLYILY